MNMSILLLWLVALPAVLILLGGLIALQVWLSRKPSRLLGLILPAVSLLLSLVVLIGVLPFGVFFGMKLSSGGLAYLLFQPGMAVRFALAVLSIFLLTNIPTMVFLIIYFISRRPLQKKKELSRMQIEDLR